MKNIFLSLLLLIILQLPTVCLTAQNDISVTIFLNDSEIRNVHILKQKNEFGQIHRLCVINEKQSFNSANELDTIYYPEDIKSFILNNGQKFISGKVNINEEEKTVFLKEILNKPVLELYSYKNNNGEHIFMKEKDGILSPISGNMEPYKEYLLELANTSCVNITEKELNQLKPDRYSIVDSYKAVEKCNINLLTRKLRFGVKVGFNRSFSIKDEEETYETSNDISFGLFADIPLNYNYFSFNTEIYYQKEVYERKSFVLPLQARYTHLNFNGKILPYIEAGPVLGYIKEKDTYDEEKTSNIYYGITTGVGIEYKFHKNHSLYTGIRYMYGNGSGIGVRNLQLNLTVNIL